MNAMSIIYVLNILCLEYCCTRREKRKYYTSYTYQVRFLFSRAFIPPYTILKDEENIQCQLVASGRQTSRNQLTHTS